MPKSHESFENTREETLPQEPSLEQRVELPETQGEIKEVVAKEIEQLKKVIENSPEKEEEQLSLEEREKVIREYQGKHLPDYLKKKPRKFLALAYKLSSLIYRHETKDRENVPSEGPFLVASNHFGNEGIMLSQEFQNHDLHVSVGRKIWWERSKILQWIFKKARTLPVEESLANLSEEEKEEALQRQDAYGKKVFRDIIDKEKAGGLAVDKEFIRSAVATLSRGDAVSIFPEGLWLNPNLSAVKPREKQELKQAYQGLELLAKEFKRVTGKELKILPVAVDEDRKSNKKPIMHIGQSVNLSENKSDLSDTDWIMSQIASMLPEEQHGYYKESAASLQG